MLLRSHKHVLCKLLLVWTAESSGGSPEKLELNHTLKKEFWPENQNVALCKSRMFPKLSLSSTAWKLVTVVLGKSKGRRQCVVFLKVHVHSVWRALLFQSRQLCGIRSPDLGKSQLNTPTVFRKAESCLLELSRGRIGQSSRLYTIDSGKDCCLRDCLSSSLHDYLQWKLPYSTRHTHSRPSRYCRHCRVIQRWTSTWCGTSQY